MSAGNFFEDFSVGQILRHATPRTLSDGDASLYQALYGSRLPVTSSAPLAQSLGYAERPLDDLLVFHTVFGKTVPDISLNAVANLGYAEGRFHQPVYAGDTLRATSEVIGVKQTSNGKAGIVYVRTTGTNQRGETVLSYVRWVMVNKRDAESAAPEVVVPELAQAVSADDLTLPEGVSLSGYDFDAAGSSARYDDYEVGQKIDHVDGVTVEEAEHQLATRLYQNTAKVHFDGHRAADTRFGKRLIYGGVVISQARALQFNGLENACALLAINGGTHAAPLFAGDTVYAWTEVLDKAVLDEQAGALRLRLVATKNQTCESFPYKTDDGKYEDGVILDFDMWVAMPR